MIQGTDYLLDNLPTVGTRLDPKRDTYYWYYATQVLFHMGGERWKQWNGQLYPLLIQSQQLEGTSSVRGTPVPPSLTDGALSPPIVRYHPESLVARSLLPPSSVVRRNGQIVSVLFRSFHTTAFA